MYTIQKKSSICHLIISTSQGNTSLLKNMNKAYNNNKLINIYININDYKNPNTHMSTRPFPSLQSADLGGWIARTPTDDFLAKKDFQSTNKAVQSVLYSTCTHWQGLLCFSYTCTYLSRLGLETEFCKEEYVTWQGCQFPV